MQMTVLVVSLVLMAVVAFTFWRVVIAVNAEADPTKANSRRSMFFWALVVLGVVVTAGSLRQWPHAVATGAEVVQVNATGTQWSWEIDTQKIPVGKKVLNQSGSLPLIALRRSRELPLDAPPQPPWSISPASMVGSRLSIGIDGWRLDINRSHGQQFPKRAVQSVKCKFVHPRCMGDGTILVTGGAKRIGRAICVQLANDGFAIAVHHRNSASEASDLAHAIVSMGGSATTVQCDLSDPVATSTLIDEASGALGPVFGLVNNASMFVHDDIATFDEASWDAHMAVNARAPMLSITRIGTSVAAYLIRWFDALS